MCGIAGIIKFSSEQVFEYEITKLTDQLSHRGPDGEGVFCEKNIGLGHRRLSIIDLSEDGKQPMSFDEKYIITYNGEIYNYIEIKADLINKGYTFKTKTDTEVILAAYDHYGEKCLNYFNGMWSFVIFDKIKKILFCSRDRFGVKPFYYSLNKDRFIFASEIKPIISTFSQVKANHGILMEYLLMNMTDHTEDTFFEGIKTLMGSHYMIIDLQTYKISINQYYSISISTEISKLDLTDATALYQTEFERSIVWRLRSDVKVGTCLSGGLDSSYIAAIASEKYHLEGSEKFSAVTAESLGPNLNEKEYAKIVVDHLNLNWHVTSPTRNDFNESIEDLVKTQEEPFGNPSVLLQNFVMKKAKAAGITVLLDGQGADETVLGYPRYIGAYMMSLPLSDRLSYIKKVSKNYELSIPYLFLNHLYFTNFFVRKTRVKTRLGNINNEFMRQTDFSTIKELSASFGNLLELQKMEVMKTQIPQLLKWEDKNSMAYSIETRLPFLDYRLVETSLSINNDHKLGHSWSKYIMRKAMESKLPESIVWRKKKFGFAAPAEEWLKDSVLWNDVEKSPLLNAIFNKKIPCPSNIDLYWRICNIALWEKVFKIQL